MTYRISFMSANFVAKQLNYQMTEGWNQGVAATSAYFAPLTTFGERFDALLTSVRQLGFDTLDLWTAHLDPAWVTAQHLATARQLLTQHGLAVASLAGKFGATRERFEASCRIAAALEVPVLGGSTPLLSEDPGFMAATLKRYGRTFGLENHGETTPEALLAKLSDDAFGVAVDTGWFATRGYDAARALEALAERLVHVSLKDIREVGQHRTCRFGEGIVPLRECVAVLRRVGYSGAISIEHEPEFFDPSDDVRASLALLQTWLRS